MPIIYNDVSVLIDTDGYIKYRWVYNLVSKAKISSKLEVLCQQIHNTRGEYPVTLHCNRETDIRYCEKNGIKLEYARTQLPQLNAKAERNDLKISR